MPLDLLIVTPAFPADDGDDTCMPLVQSYLKALQKEHPTLRIAAIATQYPFHHEPYSWCGIKVYPCNGSNSRWRKPIALWRAWRYFRTLSNEAAPRAIHALWLSDATLIASRMALRSTSPFVVTMLGQDARDNAVYWHLIRGARPVTVSLSDGQADAFETMSGSRPHAIIPFGYGTLPEQTVADPTTDVIFCGSMYTVKRADLFVKTIALVAKEIRVSAVIFGFGPQEELRAMIRSMGLENTIDLRGGRPRKEVLSAMANARVLLHTASYEGQCYAFEEALAHGLSIVSTRVGSAETSDRWSIAETSEELATHVFDHLRNKRARTPLVRYPVSETVERYMKLYGIKVSEATEFPTGSGKSEMARE